MSEPHSFGEAKIARLNTLVITLQQEKAALEKRCAAFEARIDAHIARYDCTEKLSDARDNVDFWKAECAAAKESRDAACHERNAHAEAANQAEANNQRLKDELTSVNEQLTYAQEQLQKATYEWIAADRDNARLQAALEEVRNILDRPSMPYDKLRQIADVVGPTPPTAAPEGPVILHDAFGDRNVFGEPREPSEPLVQRIRPTADPEGTNG
jgi:chromosome segregation ATPase